MKPFASLVLACLGGFALSTAACERSCPVGSWPSDDGTCLYQLQPNDPVAIQGDELRVSLASAPSPHAYQGPYSFWFVQEAHESQTSLPLQRIGSWGLQIQQTADLSPKPWPKMKLRWKLRDPRVRLRGHETIRLALTWIQNAKRRLLVLPGHYQSQTHLVEADLPDLQGTSEIVLFPIRKPQGLAGLPQGTTLATK